jgi:hypothetical protein
VRKLFTLKYAPLVLLIVYCLDLFWKFAHWKVFAGGTPWWALTLALTVRFSFMAGLAWLYFHFKKRESIASKIQS